MKGIQGQLELHGEILSKQISDFENTVLQGKTLNIKVYSSRISFQLILGGTVD